MTRPLRLELLNAPGHIISLEITAQHKNRKGQYTFFLFRDHDLTGLRVEDNDQRVKTFELFNQDRCELRFNLDTHSTANWTAIPE